MFGIDTLDMLIGIITIYLVFGVACTAIVEVLSTLLKIRSTNLENACKEFFDGFLEEENKTQLIQQFYDHPLVQALSKGKDGRPSYIQPSLVACVIEDLLTKNGNKSIGDAIAKLPFSIEENRFKGMLNALLKRTGDDIEKLRKEVETHFDNAMDRATGWFKKKTQLMAVAIAAMLVIGANVDTLQIMGTLAESPEARIKLVEAASGIESSAQTDKEDEDRAVQNARVKIEAAAAALKRSTALSDFGWKTFPESPYDWISKTIGLIVSILAISLGAPFWFDLLQKFMRVRSSISTRDAEKQKKNQGQQ